MRVRGVVVTNPRSLVAEHDPVTVEPFDPPLRGEAKLEAALAAFRLDVAGRVALDLGAAAGGFTRVLLRAGAARVYAVDAGHGQLLGSLRQHPAVVSLERTNLAALSYEAVPDTVGVVTADLSYLALAAALPQLEGRVQIETGADLVALVKPMFELGLAVPPTGAAQLREACAHATAGAAASGWRVEAVVPSPVTGRRGAIEFLLHATRREPAQRGVSRPQART